MLLAVLVIPVVLLALTAAVGAFLPREHVAASMVVVPAERDQVWQAVRSVGAYHEWWDFVAETEAVFGEGAEERWVLYGTSGDLLPLVVESETAGELMVTRIVDEGMPFGGTWTYQLESAGPGTTVVTVVERGVIHNPLLRVAARWLVGYHGTMDGYLTALAKRFGSRQPEVTHLPQVD